MCTRQRDQPVGVERIEVGCDPRARFGRDRVAAGRHDDEVDPGLGSELPGDGMLAAAATDDEDAGRHHRQAHPGTTGWWRIGRQARSMVWVRSGPTDSSTIGTPACSSIALT